MTKTCSKCKAEPSSSSHCWCKGCISAYSKERYRNQPGVKDKVRASALQAKAKARAFLTAYVKRKRCKDCGTSDHRVFQFDHLNPKTKKYNVSEMVSSGLSVDTIRKEIRKCQVVCANCHQIRTGKRAGFWWVNGE